MIRSLYLAAPQGISGEGRNEGGGNMADNFIWKDLSQAQLLDIRHPHPKKGLTGRDLLAKHLGIVQPEGLRNPIDLDLYVHTLQFGESQHFADDKLSGLLSIVKAVHTRSVQAKLTAERSFSLFKELLLKHSVQRPPYSIGLFSYAEMKRVMDWMLDTYYRHFKLYQYAFTDRVTMSVAQVHPLDTIELLTELQPLDSAITEEQHQEQLTEEERKREQDEAAAREAAAAEVEAARLAKLREEYVASIPDEVQQRVQAALAKEVELLQGRMQEQFGLQQQSLMAKITELEGKLGGKGAARPPSSKR